jgi:uncharacterized repeat protein (TIGR03803 family)
LGKSDSLVGVTYAGGASGCCGTVFELTPGGAFTTLYTFKGIPDGAMPVGGLIFDNKANAFLGTTSTGGETNHGTIFKLTSDGAESVLHSFTGTDGSDPQSSLAQDGAGNLYGTTLLGGAYAYGVVFEMAIDGSYSVLHSFTAGADGSKPVAHVTMLSDGSFAGTASSGGDVHCQCGTVFKLTPQGVFTTIHTFAGSDGSYPQSGLIEDQQHNLIGTASGGAGDRGVIFKISPDNTYTILHSFSKGEGAGPIGDLLSIRKGKKFYGTAVSGGANNHGTVFSITANGRFKTLYSFGDIPDGQDPYAGVITSHGLLFGTTADGGGENEGTMFSLSKK